MKIMELKQPFSIEIFQTLTSTQLELRQQLGQKHDLPHLHSLMAMTQTAARGRLDHRWESLSGNLHASILIRHRPAIGLTWIPHWVGCAIVSALVSLGKESQSLKLKWPNDLLIQTQPSEWKKAGGILCETFREVILVGVGLNVSSAPSLTEASSLGLSEPKEVLEAILHELSKSLSQRALQEKYLELSYFLPGDHVEWVDERDSTLKSGKILGLGEYGELKVKTEDSEKSLFSESVQKVRLRTIDQLG